MDSPLSEADSLSSPGASTEPLPGSDDQPSSPVRSSTRANDQGGGDSDSSLTEQESSDNDRDDLSSLAESVQGGGRRAVIEDDEEEEEEAEDADAVSTPRASGSNKRARAVLDDEDDEKADEVDAILALATGAALKKSTSHDLAPARPLTDDEDEVLSSASDASDDADHLPPAKKRLKPAGSVGSATSTLLSAAGAARAISPEMGIDPALDGGAGSESDEAAGAEEDENDADAEEEDSAPVLASPKGKKGKGAAAARGKAGARARPGAKGAAGKTTAAAAMARVRSGSSPLSVVSSSASEDEAPLASASGSAAVAALQSAAGALAAPEPTDESVEEALMAKVSAAGGKGKGGGKARGKAKVAKGKGRGAAARAMSRSTSAESSLTAPADAPSQPLTNGTSSTPLPSNLPVPSGLVELDAASSPATLAGQLADYANGTGGGAGEGEGGGAGNDSAMEGVELGEPLPSQAGELDAHPSLDAELELEPEPEPEPAYALEHVEPPVRKGSKKGGGGSKSKKGGKGGKGKEKAQVVDVEWVPPGTAVEEEGQEGSEHEEDTSDAAFMRKRAEAMEALTKIEIQFAQLRDVLYIERMQEIEKERIGIENGSHPELLHLTQLIELRRDNKLQLAKRWLDGLERSYQLQYDHGEHALWNRWQDERARLRTRMLDEANAKRRRLEREKRVLDRPKDDSLANILAPRPPPAVPLHHRRRLGFDGEPLVDNEIPWALRHPDVRADAGVQALDDEAAYSDLERMGLREPIRRPLYPYEQLYAHPPALAPSAFADPRTTPAPSHIAAGFGYTAAAYDPSALALQQSAFPAFGALPPLPGARAEQLAPTRPPSQAAARIPGGFASDLAAGPAHNVAYPSQPTPRNAFSNGHYPYDVEAEQRLQGPAAWAKASQAGSALPAHAFDDDQRRRTISAGGALGAGEPLDGMRNGPMGAAAHAAALEQNGGRRTPTGASAAKARMTLDDHMSHRSPKAAAPSPASTATGTPSSAAGKAQGAAAAARSPAAFMSIPAIPPFDRQRHEQHLLQQAQARAAQQIGGPPLPVTTAPAQAQQAPAAAALPPLPGKSALFGTQAPTGAAPGQAAQAQAYAVPPTAQRAA
ncbi:hypothetical protein JCM10207_001093 [Rhodosporidiobolus poonsookiae]